MFAVLRGWLACFYNAALWSMLASVILFNNTWLEMRVNIGLVFFALTGFFCVTVCTVTDVEIEGNELYDDESIREWVQNDRYSWNTLYVYFKYRFKKSGYTGIKFNAVCYCDRD